MKILLPLAVMLGLSACVTTPASPSSGTATARFGTASQVGPVRVTPLTLIEDSRCPANVQCVWAGQVRISAELATSGGKSTRELTSGKPIGVAGGMLVLESVAPPKTRADSPIARSDYRFSLRYTANTMATR